MPLPRPRRDVPGAAAVLSRELNERDPGTTHGCRHNPARIRRPSAPSVAAAMAFVASLAGCSDDGPSPKVAPPEDVRLGGLGLAPCKERLSGTEPFGQALSGEFVSHDQDEPTESYARASADIYFPQGRRPGAEVIVMDRNPSTGRIEIITSATLDQTLGADISLSGKSDLNDYYLEGRLIGPDDGIAARVAENWAPPESDIADFSSGYVKLCPAGELPAPELHTGGRHSPLGAVRFAPTVPIAHQEVHAWVDSTSIPVETSISDGQLVVWAVDAFPPNRVVSFDLSHTKDVLGRTYAVKGLPLPLRTREVLTDMTFETQPPAEAIVCDACGVADGKLRIYSSTSVMIALPDPEPLSNLLRVSAEITGYCTFVHFVVVDADGQASTVATAYSETKEVAEAGTLPSSRPLWLVIEAHGEAAVAQWSPPPSCSLEVEELVYGQ